MSYSLAAIDSNIAEPIDLTTRLESCTFAYDRHGCADLSATIRMPLLEQYRFFNASATREVFVSWNGGAVWRGRMERCAVGDKVMTITAAGNWRELLDTPYTALWSTTSVSDFRPAIISEITNAFPDRYTVDTNNRVYITANKGETLGTTTIGKVAYMVYITPNQGSRTITNVSFDYSFSSTTNWQMGVNSYDDSWGSGTSVYSLNGAGAGTVTGSQSLTLGTPRNRIAFYLYFTAADAVVAAETGNIFVSFTNIRLKTTTASTVLSSAIVSNLVATTALNSRVTTTTLDFQDETYEDMYLGTIIDRLALLENYRAYVDLADTVVYENANVVREPTYLINATNISVERALDKLYNARYAVYKDASGRAQRTASSSNVISAAQYGITRTSPVSANTTSSTQATTIRDTALADTAQAPPRARFTVRQLTDWFGMLIPLHQPRPGDSASIVNLPPIADAAISSPRSFIIGRTAVQIGRGLRPSVVIEPEDPAPSLDVYLARIAEGI